MLAKENFTKEHIEHLRLISGNDPSILEKTVYAFGLLEAISKVGMPFIFKGGTCLMLLLDEPKRLSTDIDIVVEPGTDVETYIKEAGKLFPFETCHEDVRGSKNGMEKRHYEFGYKSSFGEKAFVILLDVLFEKNHYSTIIEKPIKNDILLTEDGDLTVKVPDVNCILGDKLTAFAPHTTGIPFGVGKEMEIIKQLFDCATLSKAMDSFESVKDVYHKVVSAEISYRGISCDAREVLKDTIRSCLCIIAKGKIEKEEYSYFLDGIRRIGGHIYNGRFNPDEAAYIACEVMYLAVCLYKEVEHKSIDGYDGFISERLAFKDAKFFSYLRKIHPESYAYFVASCRILENEIEDLIN